MKTSLNLRFYGFCLFIANLLWLKCLYDLIHFSERKPSFSFPSFFIPLFTLASLAFIGYSIYSYRRLNQSFNKTLGFEVKTGWLYLLISLSVICTAPVCYRYVIFLAAYPLGAVIRISLILVPLLIFFLSYRKQKDYSSYLLPLALFGLLPNDKCWNPFNYWWVDTIGASPLSYMPTVALILFSYPALRQKIQWWDIAVAILICFGALFIALGHRLRIIW